MTSEQLLISILRYLRTAIYLEPLKKRFYETEKSEEHWFRTESVFEYMYRDTNLSREEKIADAVKNGKFDEFHDDNVYMQELLTTLNNKGLNLTPFELRMKENYTKLYSEPVLSNNKEAKIDEQILENWDYFYRSYFNNYYFSVNSMYLDFFNFNYIVFNALKAYQNFITTTVELGTEETRILINFMESFGFIYAKDIPTNLKSTFALKMFEFYRTKGSEDVLIDILNESGLQFGVNGVYMFLDEFDNIKVVKIPYEKDVSTEDKFHDFLNDLNRNKENKQYYLEYDDITKDDNEWYASEDEVKEILREYPYIKTKYHYIDYYDYHEVSYLMSMLSVIERWADQQISFTFDMFADYTLTKITSILDAIIHKIKNPTYNIKALIAQEELVRIKSTSEYDNLKNRALGLKTIGQLEKFFKTELENYRKMLREVKHGRKRFYVLPVIPSGDNRQTFEELFKDDEVFNTLDSLKTFNEVEDYVNIILPRLNNIYSNIGIPENGVPDYVMGILNYYKNFYSKIVTKAKNEDKIIKGDYTYFTANFAGYFEILACSYKRKTTTKVDRTRCLFFEEAIKQIAKFDERQKFRFGRSCSEYTKTGTMCVTDSFLVQGDVDITDCTLHSIDCLSLYFKPPEEQNVKYNLLWHTKYKFGVNCQGSKSVYCNPLDFVRPIEIGKTDYIHTSCKYMNFEQHKFIKFRENYDYKFQYPCKNGKANDDKITEIIEGENPLVTFNENPDFINGTDHWNINAGKMHASQNNSVILENLIGDGLHSESYFEFYQEVTKITEVKTFIIEIEIGDYVCFNSNLQLSVSFSQTKIPEANDYFFYIIPDLMKPNTIYRSIVRTRGAETYPYVRRTLVVRPWRFDKEGEYIELRRVAVRWKPEEWVFTKNPYFLTDYFSWIPKYAYADWLEESKVKLRKNTNDLNAPDDYFLFIQEESEEDLTPGYYECVIKIGNFHALNSERSISVYMSDTYELMDTYGVYNIKASKLTENKTYTFMLRIHPSDLEDYTHRKNFVIKFNNFDHPDDYIELKTAKLYLRPST